MIITESEVPVESNHESIAYTIFDEESTLQSRLKLWVRLLLVKDFR